MTVEEIVKDVTTLSEPHVVYCTVNGEDPRIMKGYRVMKAIIATGIGLMACEMTYDLPSKELRWLLFNTINDRDADALTPGPLGLGVA